MKICYRSWVRTYFKTSSVGPKRNLRIDLLQEFDLEAITTKISHLTLFQTIKIQLIVVATAVMYKIILFPWIVIFSAAFVKTYKNPSNNASQFASYQHVNFSEYKVDKVE